MGTLKHLRTLRIGPHAAGDFLGDPAGDVLVSLAPEGVEVVTDFEPISREDLEAGDGVPFAALQGRRIAQVSGLTLPLRGLKDGAGDDVVAAAATKMDGARFLLEAVCGRAPRAGRGRTTAASPGSGDELVIGGGSVAGHLEPGDAVLVLGVDGRRYARFVVNRHDNTLQLCRPLLDDAGAPVDPAAEAVVYAGAVWQTSAAADEPLHYQIDAEDAVARRRILGATGSAQLRLAFGNYLALVLGEITGTSWDAPPKAAPGYAMPNAGKIVKVLRSPFCVGTQRLWASNFAFDFGARFEPRESDDAPAGFWGHVLNGHRPQLTADLHYGLLDREVDDALLATLQGESLQDLLVQWGGEPGQAAALRMPHSDVRARVVAPAGQMRVRIEAFGAKGDAGLDSAAGELGQVQIAIF